MSSKDNKLAKKVEMKRLLDPESSGSVPKRFLNDNEKSTIEQDHNLVDLKKSKAVTSKSNQKMNETNDDQSIERYFKRNSDDLDEESIIYTSDEELDIDDKIDEQAIDSDNLEDEDYHSSDKESKSKSDAEMASESDSDEEDSEYFSEDDENLIGEAFNAIIHAALASVMHGNDLHTEEI